MLLTHSATLYVITILVWGTSWFAITFQLGVVPPEISLVYRFGLAAVLLLLYCLYRSRSLKFTIKQHCFIAAQGVCLFCVNYLIFYYATGYLTSGLVAVIFSSVIIMNMLNGALFLRRPIQPLVVVGAVTGLAGITLVFWPEVVGASDITSPGVMKGLVLSLVATYMASLGNILSARNQADNIPVIEANALGMAYGSIVMLVYAVLSAKSFVFEWTSEYVVSLLYLSVFASIIAFGAYLTILGRIGADRAAYATVLFPIVALIISGLFENYTWGLLSITGIALVLLGNFIVTKAPRITS